MERVLALRENSDKHEVSQRQRERSEVLVNDKRFEGEDNAETNKDRQVKYLLTSHSLD